MHSRHAEEEPAERAFRNRVDREKGQPLGLEKNGTTTMPTNATAQQTSDQIANTSTCPSIGMAGATSSRTHGHKVRAQVTVTMAVRTSAAVTGWPS